MAMNKTERARRLARREAAVAWIPKVKSFCFDFRANTDAHWSIWPTASTRFEYYPSTGKAMGTGGHFIGFAYELEDLTLLISQRGTGQSDPDDDFDVLDEYKGPPKTNNENAAISDDQAFEKVWDAECETCGASPVVKATGMCGPCTFGEAETVGGNW